MGQSISSDLDTVDNLPDELYRQARHLSEVATLSYDEFLQYLKQLNELSQKCMDADGKQLVFAVKEGSDSTVLWKGMIRIACAKIDPVTNKVETYRLLNLNQFLKFEETVNEAKTRLLEGDISKAIELLSTAVDSKSSPSLQQLVAVQMLLARLPSEKMQEFHNKHKKFFGNSKKFLEMDVTFEADKEKYEPKQSLNSRSSK